MAVVESVASCLAVLWVLRSNPPGAIFILLFFPHVRILHNVWREAWRDFSAIAERLPNLNKKIHFTIISIFVLIVSQQVMNTLGFVHIRCLSCSRLHIICAQEATATTLRCSYDRQVNMINFYGKHSVS